MDTVKPKEIIIYADSNGREPFTEWLYGLRDLEGRRRIMIYVQRLGEGMRGNCEPVQGISELKMKFSPGYRVYFKECGDKVLILLGGDKHSHSSQQDDIQQAKSYWDEYKKREEI